MARVLTFHGLGEPKRDLDRGEAAVWVDADLFEAVLDRVVGDRLDVTITFDDGNASDVEVALPSLLSRGLRATFFVLAGKLDHQGFLTSHEVRLLADAGMEIGTHGMHHRDWRTLDDRSLDVELVQSRDWLEDLLGQPVRQAACPFGSYDRRVLARARAAGYERVYTSDSGAVRWHGWLVPRTTVHAGDEVASLARHTRLASWPAAAMPMVRRAAKRMR